MKQALLADDYDTLLQVARDQVEGGAHVLDVQVALTERGDEVEQMRQAVKKLEMGIEAPLVIDSTEADVIQAALETYPGRAIINSINLENRAPARRGGAAAGARAWRGGRRADHRRGGHGQDASSGSSPSPSASTRSPPRSIGLKPEALLFDALTFPVTTGQEELRD